MDLTTYLRDGHFEREIQTLMEHPEKHGLIYLASGGVKDINLVKEFQQKMLLDYIPTLKASFGDKYGGVENGSDGKRGCYDGVSLRIRTLQDDGRK